MVNATTFSGFIANNKSTLTLVIMIIIFSILAHIAIISVILKKTSLAKQRYYIVANISACDCCFGLVFLIWYIRFIIDGYFIIDTTNYLLSRFASASFRVSLFCTRLLSFDRYIAVSRALRYHEIITRARIFKVISSFWIINFLLIVVSFLLKEESEFFNDVIERLVMNIILFILIFLTSIFIIFVAAYTIKIRKRHIAIIKSRTTQFGVEAEKLNILQSLKGSIHDVMRLNILTIIFILPILLFSILLLSGYVRRTRYLAFSLYYISNPVIYISVLSELRAEMKKIFCRNNRVGVERTDQQIRISTV